MTCMQRLHDINSVEDIVKFISFLRDKADDNWVVEFQWISNKHRNLLHACRRWYREDVENYNEIELEVIRMLKFRSPFNFGDNYFKFLGVGCEWVELQLKANGEHIEVFYDILEKEE